ncbi:MAG TPA: replication-associated recombination protein A [Leptospiraceae bacterium]|nr:replication-associated recombination protein A [Leptospiraceae bacterium]HMW04255.1 replication-associated recombination protein A [Leptospiraceae bacterium]HMX30601.1 replication-associated recombination protein A [Leptospiraceae bacterium]HMY31301.1 replication-associated recombination protein A [Leptospiraceae bacterium]HMZ63414.1 replication-associated recombination protein A [Leptospiraceae bacterium]
MSGNLFSSGYEPLASRLRPEQFEDLIGQSETIQILKKLKRPVSMILYGPPGSGKTTIAKILSKNWKLNYKHLSAISVGVKEVKELITESKKIGTILLFLDEIHRFSTSQQDSLLEAVESGQIILVAATTENPAFRINRPLLSRCQIFKLKPFTELELLQILDKALQKEGGKLELDAESKKIILNASGGDARRLLGIIEALHTIEPEKPWDKESIESYLSSQVFNYDRNKENHYDFISAFIKSVRGSDPDASLYYLACMLEGGEDPIFIMRRLIILATEDIGNASLQALPLAVSALTALEKIGMPEGRILLGQVTTYLASCPKSNASYTAIDSALAFVRENGVNVTIPNHLRNAPTFLHKKEGASDGYKYPHDVEDHFILENYFPKELSDFSPQFYFPTNQGMDKNLKERLKSLWEKTGRKKYD